MAFDRVAVLGLGKVGLLAATLLHEAGFEVVGSTPARRGRPTVPHRVADMSSQPRCGGRWRRPGGAVVPALSPQPRPRRGRPRAGHPLLRPHRGRAHHAGHHRDERHLQRVMAPQCGLAPGFVGIVAASQIASSTSAARSACAWARCRSTPPACSATRSTGRPKAWSTSTSTTARSSRTACARGCRRWSGRRRSTSTARSSRRSPRPADSARCARRTTAWSTTSTTRRCATRATWS